MPWHLHRRCVAFNRYNTLHGRIADRKKRVEVCALATGASSMFHRLSCHFNAYKEPLTATSHIRPATSPTADHH